MQEMEEGENQCEKDGRKEEMTHVKEKKEKKEGVDRFKPHMMLSVKGGYSCFPLSVWAINKPAFYCVLKSFS